MTTQQQDDLRKLVRRDLAVVLVGVPVAVWLGAIWAAGRLGYISSKTSATVSVLIGTVLCVACIGWWAAGPKQWRRDRYMVLVPVCLGAPWALLGLYDLGASVVAVILSSAFGFLGAVALGLAVASRRR
ncbi:MAG TPA: hypothetical protein VFH74_07345 [Gaiellales bacterium]|nr:hypothetical protein [Gaiellales bacterium]